MFMVRVAAEMVRVRRARKLEASTKLADEGTPGYRTVANDERGKAKPSHLSVSCLM